MTFLHQSRNIRELRMGPGKSYKTGSIFETYPLPILGLVLDKDGLSVVQKRRIKTIRPDEIESYLKMTSDEILKHADIIEVNYANIVTPIVTEDWKPQSNSKTFKEFYWNVNKLGAATITPFKTVVLDNLSSLQDFNMQYMPEHLQGKDMLFDARKWAPAIGNKAIQVASVIWSLPCHGVVICHDETKENDVTGKTSTMPMLYGNKTKLMFPNQPSQFFYQINKFGKSKLFTVDFDQVVGLGARWPHGLPNEIENPNFQNIYERTT